MSIIRDIIGDSTPIKSEILPGEYVASSSLSRVYRQAANGFFILSAFRLEHDKGDRVGSIPRGKAMGFDKSLSQANMLRHQELLALLAAGDVGYVSLFGRWSEGNVSDEELSVLVPYDNLETATFAGDPEDFLRYAVSLGDKYDQSAIVVYHPSLFGEVQLYTTRDYTDDDGDRHTKGDTFGIGKFRPADIDDQYLSALLRANSRSTRMFKVQTDGDREADLEIRKDMKRGAGDTADEQEAAQLRNSYLADRVLPQVGVAAFSAEKFASVRQVKARNLLYILDEQDRRDVAGERKNRELAAWSATPVKFKGEK